jgi:hypothetical protein
MLVGATQAGAGKIRAQPGAPAFLSPTRQTGAPSFRAVAKGWDSMTCPSDLELHSKAVGDRAIESHPLLRSCKTRAASPQRMGHPAISDVVPIPAWITAVQPATLTSGSRLAHRAELSSPLCAAAEHVSSALVNTKSSHRLDRIVCPLLSPRQE